MQDHMFVVHNKEWDGNASTFVPSTKLCVWCQQARDKHTSFGLCTVNGVTSQYFTTTKQAEPTCDMCGVPFSGHDGLVAMCRKYHRLRAEIMDIANQAKSASQQFIANGNRTILSIVGQLEWALEAAASNQCENEDQSQ